MADEKRTQFDYLLNAVLHAAQADKPAEHGYRDKTLALFAYVRQLEAVAQQGEGPKWDPVTDVDRLIADGFKRHGYRQGTKECIAFFQGACYAIERNGTAGVMVDAKPYAYEFGRSNGDGTYSVVIERGSMVNLGPNKWGYGPPKDPHPDHPVKPLYERPAGVLGGQIGSPVGVALPLEGRKG